MRWLQAEEAAVEETDWGVSVVCGVGGGSGVVVVGGYSGCSAL